MALDQYDLTPPTLPVLLLNAGGEESLEGLVIALDANIPAPITHKAIIRGKYLDCLVFLIISLTNYYLF